MEYKCGEKKKGFLCGARAAAVWRLGRTKEGRKYSFLKKRSKKLLSVAGSTCASAFSATPDEICKSLFASFSSEKEESSLTTSEFHCGEARRGGIL